MNRLPQCIAATLFASTGLIVTRATAEESTPAAAPECKVKLEDSDVRAITLEILREQPLLSSSSGIKFADATCEYYSTNERIGLEARLREGGNPADPNDWGVHELPVL